MFVLSEIKIFYGIFSHHISSSQQPEGTYFKFIIPPPIPIRSDEVSTVDDDFIAVYHIVKKNPSRAITGSEEKIDKSPSPSQTVFTQVSDTEKFILPWPHTMMAMFVRTKKR